MATRIGRRNKRVKIQTPSYVRNATRMLVPDWSNPITLIELWGYVRTPRGWETEVADQQKAMVTHAIECNWPGSVKIPPQARCVVGGSVFQIAAATDPDGRTTTLLLLCTETVAPKENP